MDKPTAPAYMPPIPSSRPTPAPLPGNVAASHWQATERNSFESALNRISNRSNRVLEPDDSRSTDAKEIIEDNLDSAADAVANEVTDESLLSAEQNPGGVQSITQRSGSPLSADSFETQSIDSALGGLEVSGGVMVEGMSTEGAGPKFSSAQVSSAGSTSSAETVAQMMTRLDRTPGTHDGQWRFGVLNDQAGVTALQLQRSLQGGWRVNVSFNEAAQIDEERHADELKAALLKEGHDVDSVVISRLASHLAFDDD